MYIYIEREHQYIYIYIYIYTLLIYFATLCVYFAVVLGKRKETHRKPSKDEAPHLGTYAAPYVCTAKQLAN